MEFSLRPVLHLRLRPIEAAVAPPVAVIYNTFMEVLSQSDLDDDDDVVKNWSKDEKFTIGTCYTQWVCMVGR